MSQLFQAAEDPKDPEDLIERRSSHELMLNLVNVYLQRLGRTLGPFDAHQPAEVKAEVKAEAAKEPEGRGTGSEQKVGITRLEELFENNYKPLLQLLTILAPEYLLDRRQDDG